MGALALAAALSAGRLDREREDAVLPRYAGFTPEDFPTEYVAACGTQQERMQRCSNASVFMNRGA